MKNWALILSRYKYREFRILRNVRSIYAVCAIRLKFSEQTFSNLYDEEIEEDFTW